MVNGINLQEDKCIPLTCLHYFFLHNFASWCNKYSRLILTYPVPDHGLVKYLSVIEVCGFYICSLTLEFLFFLVFSTDRTHNLQYKFILSLPTVIHLTSVLSSLPSPSIFIFSFIQSKNSSSQQYQNTYSFAQTYKLPIIT